MEEIPILESRALPALPSARPEESPLHDDVRFLSTTLGNVIRRLEGEDAFLAVEELRRSTRARRHGEPDAPDLTSLLKRVETLTPELAAIVARAFTLFFLLINTAEQVHRVRRGRAYERQDSPEPQQASARWTMRQLRSAGHSAGAVLDAIQRLAVRPVLTAHPTESTRRTLLALQTRVAALLLEHEVATSTARRAVED